MNCLRDRCPCQIGRLRESCAPFLKLKRGRFARGRGIESIDKTKDKQFRNIREIRRSNKFLICVHNIPGEYNKLC